jgi:leader peptidase (prepilin peptidase)/N-methyltransferase
MLALYALFGMLVGAFLNLCADQLPIWRRVHRLPFCPSCELSRPVWAWAGTVAFLRSKPQCLLCGAPISLRHPLVELGTASLYALLWLSDGPSALLVQHSVYSAILILVIVIDLEHMLIPNAVIYPAWGIALLGSLLYPIQGSFRSALAGAAAGTTVLALSYLAGRLFVDVMGRVRGRRMGTRAFGLGDVRLGVFVGLIVGYPQVLLALLFAILPGGLTACIYLLVQHVVHHRHTPYTVIPYGPFLATAGLLVMLLQRQVAQVLLIS